MVDNYSDVFDKDDLELLDRCKTPEEVRERIAKRIRAKDFIYTLPDEFFDPGYDCRSINENEYCN